MASLREIRRKIKSVKSTQQITKAMKMVAAARMRRAQNAILSSRPFAVKMESAVRELALLEVASDMRAGQEIQIHPFFDQRQQGPACLVLVTADKGLCGAFNANLLRAAVDWIRKHQDRRILLAVVGRKGKDFLHRLKGVEFESLVELMGVFPKVSFAHAELLGKPLLEAYSDRGVCFVDILYNEFKSAVQQKIVSTRLLPIPVPQEISPETLCNASSVFKFEPDREKLLAALLPRYVKAQLYRILLESQAAELAARMNAMDSASKNASELIGGLTLWMNRTRQAIITREIAELVGGAEALVA
jgi:F-type H+-transporting ATPase subunit gamma